MKILNTSIENTPFIDLTVTHKGEHIAWLKQYISVNRGMYGHQVCQESNHGDYDVNFEEYKTSGCGYCKATQGFEVFLKSLLGKYVSLGGDVEYIFRGTKYHKGGNYYSVPLSVLKRIVKNRGKL